MESNHGMIPRIVAGDKVNCANKSIANISLGFRDAVAESTHGFCGPLDSAFEHVRALDNRRSTARHNSIGAVKPADLSGKSTTLCQFSQWRAVGGGGQ